MVDERIAGLINNYIQSFEKGDVETSVSMFTENGSITCPEGKFQGKENIKRYLENMKIRMKDLKITCSGNKILTNNNKGLVEHDIAATIDGKRGSVLAMCAYEFEGDKITNIRTTYDRLTVAKQAAKGFIAQSLVNMVVKETEKGF